MQRKDVGEEYNTLKQPFFSSLTHANCQDYVSNPSQWHFPEKKKVTYESVQPCFVLHECFNRASVI